MRPITIHGPNLNERAVRLEGNAIILHVDPRILDYDVVGAIDVPAVRVGGPDAIVIPVV